ncbi:sensor domain-containing diguanylate cyclase [Psychromonas antarctica]|jgi:diguanylate cyclase (GGDEF)-like protein|uniref:sensor domain-containing diguanylate cyclase n=1 Tax=Psychromonas antarctica TaxID=67573 RepID=UPI001EE86A9B|nr:sensor domain-containing diguanylate cyclase [Psychromonas antarctica]MCG6200789.1 GGDEF domain-containing protein [Psychromonas antarctica]
MEGSGQFTEFSKLLQELSSIGFIILDRRMNVIFWNRFMELHSHIKSNEIINRKLTSFFPDVNEAWLSKKIRSTLVLNNQAVTSWEQRAYLLKLPSTQYSIDDVDFMYQNCTYFPVKNSDNTTIAVGIAIYDVTEIAISQRLLENVTEQALDLQEISTHDHLTGLFNRKFFSDQLVQDVSRCRRLDWGLGLAMIDADYFKQINDTYGHQIGDEVLKELAQRLQRTLRTFDSLCRYGGEEFALILPNVDKQQTLMICERLRECVNQSPIICGQQKIQVTVSIGTARFEKNKSLEEMIAEADAALYLAKHNGRNRVEQHQTK